MDAIEYQVMRASQPALLTPDFKAYRIDSSAFGFHDQPAFLARESVNVVGL